MKYPDFFDKIEHIVLKDELSEFLGATEGGIIDISYLEIVKMAGHSCGVVSGAYLTAQKGLKALFGEELPKRGEIKVELKGTLEDNTGVTAQVLSNITGATTDTGFLGLPNGKFNRRNLMFFGADIQGDVRFTRLDTGKSVDVKYMPGKVVNPKETLMTAIGPEATEESRRTFPTRWQEMVKTIFDNADKVIEIV
ncbi:MAG: hypothetical protein GXO47_02940 [Chlorobi bacterium]|nr:hypothetical protein [Chlorobiota bacterium]